MENISIISSYIAGAIGKITELHATYYSKHSEFGLFFESKVGKELIEFLNRYKKSQDGIWLALHSNEIIGSIVIDGIKAQREGAHLRWFIVSQEFQNKGIGGKLIKEAIEFCKKCKYNSIFLWTFKGLDLARHLYEKNGFKLIEESEGNQWGKVVIEQKFQLVLSEPKPSVVYKLSDIDQDFLEYDFEPDIVHITEYPEKTIHLGNVKIELKDGTHFFVSFKTKFYKNTIQCEIKVEAENITIDDELKEELTKRIRKECWEMERV